MIALQWCVSFCFITKWISSMYTYIPISLPSCISLPPSLSHLSRWSQSTELISLCYAAASHQLPILRLVVYICPCHCLVWESFNKWWSLFLGPKVVSKEIPVESIEEVSKIIKRAPVIWDNIHANDYDQKRLFLGPYKGRSTELIPRLKGVLTNPNCEFEANYVAIHTLATWYKSNMNGVRKDVVMSK